MGSARRDSVRCVCRRPSSPGAALAENWNYTSISKAVTSSSRCRRSRTAAFYLSVAYLSEAPHNTPRQKAIGKSLRKRDS